MNRCLNQNRCLPQHFRIHTESLIALVNGKFDQSKWFKYLQGLYKHIASIMSLFKFFMATYELENQFYFSVLIIWILSRYVNFIRWNAMIRFHAEKVLFPVNIFNCSMLCRSNRTSNSNNFWAFILNIFNMPTNRSICQVICTR